MLMSLALMLVLGTLSFSMLQAVGLEQRLADQERDRQVAFHAAEAALRQAQSLIEGNELGLFSPLRDANFPSICTKGLCRGSPAKPAWKTLSALDWADGATPIRTSANASGLLLLFTDGRTANTNAAEAGLRLQYRDGTITDRLTDLTPFLNADARATPTGPRRAIPSSGRYNWREFTPSWTEASPAPNTGSR